MTELDANARTAIAQLLAGEQLDPEILASAVEHVIQRFPDYVDTERTAGVVATVEWVIVDADGNTADRVIVAIDDAAVSVRGGAATEPRVTLTLDAIDFLRLATSNVSPATLVLSGRLELSGDVAFALEMASFLRMPGAEAERGAAEAADPGAVDAAEIAAVVATTPEAELRRAMRGPIRALVLGEVIRRFPDYVDAERTAGVVGAVEWLITDGAYRERFVVCFDDGSVATGRELDAEPRVTLELDAVDFLRLATGSADPATLFIAGRLGLSGDELFAIEMASFLRIPGSDGEVSAEQAIDPSAVDADRIAAAVRDAPDDALRRGMRGAIRGLILDEIFRRFPDYFRRGAVGSSEVAIGFKITGRADGGADRYKVLIRGGEVRAAKDLEVEPRVTIVIDGVDFLKLVTGNANPVMTFMTGKLKVRGDLGFAAQLPGLFKIPSATG